MTTEPQTTGDNPVVAEFDDTGNIVYTDTTTGEQWTSSDLAPKGEDNGTN